MKIDILKLYDVVFEDIVKNYIEEMEDEDKVELTKSQIEEIAHKMIYKDDYMWEVIHEHVDHHISEYLKES